MNRNVTDPVTDESGQLLPADIVENQIVAIDLVGPVLTGNRDTVEGALAQINRFDILQCVLRHATGDWRRVLIRRRMERVHEQLAQCSEGGVQNKTGPPMDGDERG